MRISHLIALTLVATLGLSCARETVERSDGKSAGINFATRLATRGTVVKDAAALASAGGFDVWAFDHQSNWATTLTADKTPIMEELTVESSDGGTTWSYGEPLFWPSTGYVSFFAYGPSESATATTPLADGTPVISFSVDSDVADQTDLLIATPVKDQIGMEYTDDSSVNIVFKHALSRISFSGLLTDDTDTRTITVKEITLNNLYSAGTAPLTDPVVWTLSGSATADYTISVSSGALLSTPFTDEGEGVNLTDDDGYMFLMPQTIVRTVAQPTMDVTLIVEGKEVTYNSIVFSPSVWEAGRSYNYQLAVGADDLRIIVIDTALTLEDFNESIAMNAIYLSADKDVDAANLEFAMGVLNEMRGEEFYDNYLRFGLYAINSVTHDITIDMSTLPGGGGGADSNYTSGKILILDLRKLVTSWGDDPITETTAVVELINYSDNWTLLPSKQAPNDVDAVTGATNNEPSDQITSRGVFILQRK